MRLALRIARPPALFVWLLVTFLVLFPKGGIKALAIPLTWGYALLGISLVPLLFIRLIQLSPIRQPLSVLMASAVLLPFQLLFCYSYLQNGIGNVGYTIAIVTGFFVLPVIFLFVYPSFLHYIDPRKFRSHLCFCVLAAALWGILLFFYHPIVGKYIEIPFLTVNAGDYGTLESTKHIDRGGYLKLISTYNNGNVYGVATLILLPLYIRLESAMWKRNTVRLALALTLSRTVWLGLLLEQTLSVMAQLPNLVQRFPRIRPGRAIKQAIALVGTAGLVFVGSLFFNANTINLFLDRDLGGRAGEFQNFGEPTLLPNVPLTAFDEVLYASALRNYGILGFFAVVLIFISPFVFLLAKPEILRSPSRRAAAKGVILYAFVALADGATILIPVMAFYWFAYMTMLFGLPGEQSSLRPVATRHSPANEIAPGSLHSRTELNLPLA